VSLVHVLVAPDKFKGSLTAAEAARHLAAGLRGAGRLDLTVTCLPVADGGDGTLDAALAAGFDAVPVQASGPTGEPVDTGYARRGELALLELAAVCGLARLPGGRLRPLRATSFGLGEVMRAALAAGAGRLVLGLGGSASTDGGAGLLQALGARVLDRAGAPLAPGGGALGGADVLDLSGLDPAIRRAELIVAADVDNPLYGPDGAAAVYAPQKGADRADVAVLEAGLRRWADVVAAATGTDLRDEPGAGAAGGVGFAATAVLGATPRPGIEVMLELLGFRDRLAAADLVVIGEGSLDEQTLRGKAPAGVAAAARQAGVPVVAVAGRVGVDAARLAAAGISRAYALSDLEPDPARSMAGAGRLLELLAGRLARDWLTRPPGPARPAGQRPGRSGEEPRS
jgi:glycerate kinase